MSSINAAAIREGFSAVRATVVGDVMLDRYWYGDVERISPESPVPIVDVNASDERLGGAANVVANLAALGCQTELVSIIGDDAAGKILVELLKAHGITDRLQVDDTTRTTEKLRIVARNQQLLRVDFETRPDHEVLSKTFEMFTQLLPETDVLVLSDYGKGGLEHIGQIIRAARSTGIPVVVDPKGADFSRYRGATVITPNLKEFELAGGDASSEENLAQSAVEMARELDFGAILVTRSGEGMTFFSADGERIHSPAKSREVFDVSGAGDTVVAVIAAGIASQLPPGDLLELGNLAAGYVVSKFGTAVVDPDAFDA